MIQRQTIKKASNGIGLKFVQSSVNKYEETFANTSQRQITRAKCISNISSLSISSIRWIDFVCKEQSFVDEFDQMDWNYYWLPLETTHLVADNSQFEV